ncbi:hypothetical protein AMTRI_Chr08g164820 [Amborella trichopoda]
MEDSIYSPKNKRERPLKPQNDGDDSSHDQRTPKRRLYWADSEIISDPAVPSSTSMEESEPTMTSCSGSLSGLEKKEGHVPFQKRVKPISVYLLKSKEIEASLSAMESEFEFKRNRDCSNEEKDFKPFVDCRTASSTRQKDKPKSLVKPFVIECGEQEDEEEEEEEEEKEEEQGGGGGGEGGEVIEELEVKDEKDVIEMTGLGSYEGRPRRRLTSFSITNSMDEMVIIDHSTLESLFISSVLLRAFWCITGFLAKSLYIWVSTELADYLCEMPEASYVNCHSSFKFKLTVDPEVEFGELLPSLVSAMLEDLPTVKPHIDFVADQFIVLDQEFSKFKAIKKYMRLFKEDMEKIKMLRQENMVNGRKFSGPFHSIHDCNAEFDKKASKDKDGEKHDLDHRAQRSLTGFEMLDEGETVRPFENLEYSRLYIISENQPSYNSDEPDLGVWCKSFGPAVSWCITGYDKGTPEIWVSTETAEYLCGKPSKAMVCIRAYHIISASPDLEFDEFCRELVLDILPHFDTFKDEQTTWNYVNFHLGFVAAQPSIKSNTKKFNVDAVKEMDRKACEIYLWCFVNLKSRKPFPTVQEINPHQSKNKNTQEKPEEVKEEGGGELVPGSIVPKSRPDPNMLGRPRQRLSCFDIADLVGVFRSIDDPHAGDLFILALVRPFDGSLAIWLFNDLANYLCLIPLPTYKSFYWNKASLCIWAFKKLKKEPDMDYDKLLGSLVRTLMRRIGGNKIKFMSEEHKGQLEKIREAKIHRRWTLSGSFYSTQDFNKKHKHGVSSMNPHYSNKKNQNKPKSIEVKRAHRRLKGFTILDQKEDMHAIEDLEPKKFYISSEIRPLYGVNSNTVVQCKLFGPITSWCITGYKEGHPSIWISIKVAYYLCDEPSTIHLPLFMPLHMKAVLSIHAFQFLKEKFSRTVRELFQELILDRKKSCRVENSHLDFRAEQLIGLDMSFFSKLPAIKDVQGVVVKEAGNTKARFSFFSIDEENKCLHKCGSSFSSSEKNENCQKYQLESKFEKVGEEIMKKPESHVRVSQDGPEHHMNLRPQRASDL